MKQRSSPYCLPPPLPPTPCRAAEEEQEDGGGHDGAGRAQGPERAAPLGGDAGVLRDGVPLGARARGGPLPTQHRQAWPAPGDAPHPSALTRRVTVTNLCFCFY